MKSPESVYSALLQKHNLHLQQLLQKKSRLGWMRLFAFLILLFTAYQVFIHYGVAGWLVVVIGIVLFLYLVTMDSTLSESISNTRLLVRINEEELDAVHHRFQYRFDGALFQPAEHDYANDLDLFGPSSLYQWLQRTYTDQGKELLAKNLLSPLPVSQITERQEAVKEWAPEVEWRQQLQAIAMQTTLTQQTESRTSVWLQQEEKHFLQPAWKVVVLLYSLVTTGLAAATFFGFLPFSIFSGLYGLMILSSVVLSRNTIKPYIHLSGIVKEVAVLYRFIDWLESKTFQSSLLVHMQQQLQPEGERAAPQIKRLKTILDRFDLRISLPGFLFLNPFFLWDVRQMIALNDWRKKNKATVTKWFGVTAQAEVLHSLASLRFNQPLWCFPQFSPDPFCFEGEAIGHPLIPPAARVTSDFCLKGKPKIALVTGSNMAGKSTFLRSVGVSVMMAQMGAPVCAQRLTLSHLKLMSSMRIADNLAENTSTFYAELKKLKSIIEAVNRKEPLFILLDEILRGTNSMDRHKGSEALIHQLISRKAVAVIATHDLELAQLQEAHANEMENYHFDVQVAGEELYFDYKLKTGVCNSLNASILMKKIGIDIKG